MLSNCNMFVTPNCHFCVVKIKQAINMRKILLSVMLTLAIPTLTFAKEKKEEKKEVQSLLSILICIQDSEL